MYHRFIIISVILVCVLYFCQTLDQPEGSPCVWGQFNGTCMNINRCFTFVVDKLNKEYPPVIATKLKRGDPGNKSCGSLLPEVTSYVYTLTQVDFCNFWDLPNLQQVHSICSYKDRMPIICCTECESEHKENVSNAVFNSEVGLIWRNGRKSWDACIDYADQLPYLAKSHATYFIDKKWIEDKKCHVVVMGARAPSGGEDTKRGEYPFMALLGYGSDVASAQWLCGGAIISNRFILTAAHCISSPQFGPVKFIALGVWKRSDPTDLWQRHTVKRIIPHPEYKSPIKYNDIALLETENPIEFTMGTLPACLHSGAAPRYKFRENDEFALGWGSLGPGKHLADILQKVVLHNFTDQECAEIYPPHRHLQRGYDDATQLCYGDREKPRDTCAGDSGGPLVRPGEVSASVVKTIIGVTSYGVQCGVTAGAGIYTRVSHYLPWIESVVWP